MGDMRSALLLPEHSAYRVDMQCAYAVGMTSGSPRQLRRREKLRALIEENGGQAQVALEIGTPKSHLSAILAGRRGVGDALAQKIERHFEKPEGWFDEGEDARWQPEVDELAEAISRLPKQQRDLVLMAVRNAVALAATVTPAVAPQTERDTDAHEQIPPVRRSA